MTNEEAIRIAQGLITNFKCKSETMVDFCNMIIKALEQQVMLDKIRAEIEFLEEGIFSYYNDRPWIFKDEVLGIIDKYKTESEDKE